MAQRVYTFGEAGFGAYIPDPRVQEALALAKLKPKVRFALGAGKSRKAAPAEKAVQGRAQEVGAQQAVAQQRIADAAQGNETSQLDELEAAARGMGIGQTRRVVETVKADNPKQRLEGDLAAAAPERVQGLLEQLRSERTTERREPLGAPQAERAFEEARKARKAGNTRAAQALYTQAVEMQGAHNEHEFRRAVAAEDFEETTKGLRENERITDADADVARALGPEGGRKYLAQVAQQRAQEQRLVATAADLWGRHSALHNRFPEPPANAIEAQALTKAYMQSMQGQGATPAQLRRHALGVNPANADAINKAGSTRAIIEAASQVAGVDPVASYQESIGTMVQRGTATPAQRALFDFSLDVPFGADTAALTEAAGANLAGLLPDAENPDPADALRRLEQLRVASRGEQFYTLQNLQAALANGGVPPEDIDKFMPLAVAVLRGRTTGDVAVDAFRAQPAPERRAQAVSDALVPLQGIPVVGPPIASAIESIARGLLSREDEADAETVRALPSGAAAEGPNRAPGRPPQAAQPAPAPTFLHTTYGALTIPEQELVRDLENARTPTAEIRAALEEARTPVPGFQSMTDSTAAERLLGDWLSTQEFKWEDTQRIMERALEDPEARRVIQEFNLSGSELYDTLDKAKPGPALAPATAEDGPRARGLANREADEFYDNALSQLVRELSTPGSAYAPATPEDGPRARGLANREADVSYNNALNQLVREARLRTQGSVFDPATTEDGPRKRGIARKEADEFYDNILDQLVQELSTPGSAYAPAATEDGPRARGLANREADEFYDNALNQLVREARVREFPPWLLYQLATQLLGEDSPGPADALSDEQLTQLARLLEAQQ